MGIDGVKDAAVGTAKRVGGILGASMVVKAAANVGAGLALKAAGFSAAGPVAGSYAASWMSAIATANGGGVVAGSTYAVCQSVSMGTGAVVGAPLAIGVAAAVVLEADEIAHLVRRQSLYQEGAQARRKLQSATAYVYNELQLYSAVNDVTITTISVESDIVRTSAYASLAITAPSASPSRSLLIIGGAAPSASCVQSKCTINGNGNQCFFSYGYTDVTLQNLRIQNCNGTTLSGGALRSAPPNAASFSYIAVQSVDFIGNVAKQNGGALALFSVYAQLAVADSTFTSNIATLHGGAIYISGGPSFTVSNSTFTTNTASGSNRGGAIFLQNSAWFSISTCTFAGNIARAGGGAALEGSAPGTLYNNYFANNSVTGNNNGGAIRYSSSGTITNTYTTFYNNKQQNGALNDVRCELQNITFCPPEDLPLYTTQINSGTCIADCECRRLSYLNCSIIDGGKTIVLDGGGRRDNPISKRMQDSSSSSSRGQGPLFGQA
ncbi:hypothetical protein KFL_001570190 [Klebsormidium nitens]|uniref:Right handed beta helix domain-containing protein n=1 Tax=Klebsormidium nitens TaxID=105231 RepID=A0A0U9HT19_KLENI|nr:hypothetical protein KFL_001570190 [Klebsormidium nitens]|eukprot:GAQ83680.1 hypothetical protein KFL_001570190 [Klebsormidium nitens]